MPFWKKSNVWNDEKRVKKHHILLVFHKSLICNELSDIFVFCNYHYTSTNVLADEIIVLAKEIIVLAKEIIVLAKQIMHLADELIYFDEHLIHFAAEIIVLVTKIIVLEIEKSKSYHHRNGFY